MRGSILVALLLLALGVAAARAEDHVVLSCSHAHTVKRTMFEDGHVRTETENEPSTFSIDLDLEHKTINEFYEAPHGQQFENGSVSIGGFASKLSTDHESGYQDTISIDRLSGTAIVTHRYLPSDDCAERLGRAPSCRTSDMTTTYRCAPAALDFPTPIPRLMRSFERLRRSHFLARMRRAWRRLYTVIDREMGPTHADQ
jgi:hypothetical protein